MAEKRFTAIEQLRAPERVARLEVERVVDLALEGLEHPRYVLDVGCGSGLFTEAFAGRRLAVAGIDASEEMVAAARELVPLAWIQRAPADTIPFGDASFDLVFLGLVLHEVEQPMRVLAEAQRVCQGRVAVLEWPHREQPFGPPLEHRLEASQVRAWAREAELGEPESIELEHVVLYRMAVLNPRPRAAPDR